MRYEDLVEYKITASIVLDYIVDVIVGVAVTAGRCSLPDYLVLTRFLTEYFIENRFGIMAYMPVQMHIDASPLQMKQFCEDKTVS